jgi:ATP-binding cassette subfamily C (CFTR/MRP) protein 5
VDNAGLFSFMTFNWLTPLAVHAHRKGQLQLEDVWAVSQFESCKVNRHRSVLIAAHMGSRRSTFQG